MVDNRKIGVIDSGVGGLTVVSEFQKILPNESIIYFGDNKNVPYGKKTEEEIYRLTKNMVDFLIEKDVKLIAVACNTISTIIDKYFSEYKLPIVTIIKPAVEQVISNNLKIVGVMATEFTIKTGAYERILKEKDEKISIISEPCPNLATLIDSGQYDDEEIENNINLHIESMTRTGDLKDIVLGCTHFPIVMDKFKRLAPNVNFINPAYEQVVNIRDILDRNDQRSDIEKGEFEIYTSGTSNIYEEIIDILSMKKPDRIISLK